MTIAAKRDLAGRVVIITGASAGIGAALARHIGQKGARPVLVARREAELAAVAAEAGKDAVAMVADVTVRTDVERVIADTLARFGQIDAFVNNAGRGISRLVSQLTDEDVDEMMRVNVKSALYGMQAVLPHFRARKTGHIINISSMLGRVPFAVVRSAYSASKHALNALTANLRMELRDEGLDDVWVSTVSPGIVATLFGVSARHGGVDSRALPNAQPAEEVAAVIADVIEHPRADAYTRPWAHKLVAEYYGAEDMGEVERRPPFMAPPPNR